MQSSAKVDTYIQSFPEDVKVKLEGLRKVIRKEVPGAQEVISYGVPTFKVNGKYVVYLAAFKNHISIYPASDAMVAAIKESGKHRTGKGTLQFSFDKPLPFPLIRKIVQYLVVENKKSHEARSGYARRKKNST